MFSLETTSQEATHCLKIVLKRKHHGIMRYNSVVNPFTSRIYALTNMPITGKLISLSNHLLIFFVKTQLFNIVLKWLLYKWEQRKVHALDLLKKLRLGLVPVERLKQILHEGTHQILSIRKCKKLLKKVLTLK